MATREASADTGSEMGSLAGLSESYARWRSSQLGRITDTLEDDLILELLGPVEGLAVLDVGCGDGVLTSTLSRRGGRATGLDADPAMLAAACARAAMASTSFDLVQGRAEALPFPDAAFDRVVAVTVLCFIQQADRAIAEMARVLKPGGRLVIGELGRRNSWAAIRRIRGWLGAPTWRAARFRTAGELRRLVEGHGLTVREMRGAVYYPPSGLAASLIARVDPWLGRRTTLGAAFIALSATKPIPNADNESR